MQSEIPDDVMETAKAVVDRMPTHAFKGDCVADVAQAIMAHAVPPAAEPSVAVKACDAAERIRNYIKQRSLSRSYDGDIHGFHVGDEREALLTVADIEAVLSAFTAQVQDVAGTVEMVENCVLFSTPGEYAGLADHAAFEAGQDNAIRTVVKLLRDNLPAAPAKQEG